MAQIIVFGPHPDDQEIGMGGAIARFASQGHRVLLVDVTDGSPTPRGDRAGRLAEAEEALEHLRPVGGAGGGSVERVLLDLRNRFVEHSIATRHAFAGAIRAHQASIVFAPYWEDAHPDHRAVTRAAEDARFDAKLTKIEMPGPAGFAGIGPPIYPKWFFYYNCSHLRATARPDFLIDITGFELRKKRAIEAYRSQFGPWEEGAGSAALAAGDPKAAPGGVDTGKLISPDFPERMMAIAMYYGSLIGAGYAEPFYTKEPLGLSGLEGLV
ncbi:MAG: PIG-L family deacetylase [Phycisphaerales bacterium]|nr:PIG-L family deacetylase [Phycisphaerales bacterium]